MSKKTAAQKLWAVQRKKIRAYNETRALVESSELVHKYLIEHPVPDFDIPDEIYVPWFKAIKNLGGNV
jgi:hypothetical protein